MTRPEPVNNAGPNHCGSQFYDTDDEERADMEELIPPYLRGFIFPYHGEFCWTRTFHYRLVAYLMLEGFLPIANEHVILPKLHHERCVIPLQESGAFHVPKSIRKKSKKYTFSVNQCFDRVVEECRKQHGHRCWLYPELVRVFREIHQAGQVDCTIVTEGPRHGNAANNGSDADRTTPPGQQEVAPVRLYSIEVWNEATGELAAGELGYTVGSIYTSLTGFSAQDSAGSVQLAALGRLLRSLGFTMWDLGMDMEYKQGLGAHNIPRQDFLAHLREVRTSKGYLTLPVSANARWSSSYASSIDACGSFPNCRSIIDQEQPTSPAASQHQVPDHNLAGVDNTSTNNGKGKASAKCGNRPSQHPPHKPPSPGQDTSPEPYKKKRRG